MSWLRYGVIKKTGVLSEEDEGRTRNVGSGTWSFLLGLSRSPPNYRLPVLLFDQLVPSLNASPLAPLEGRSILLSYGVSAVLAVVVTLFEGPLQ